jgi:hypothetical protein
VRIGGAIMQNVVALIFDDKNLRIRTGPSDTYQINAVIGYPVFQSLGRVTFTHAGEFLTGSNAAADGAYSRMFMDRLTPLLQCGVSRLSRKWRSRSAIKITGERVKKERRHYSVEQKVAILRRHCWNRKPPAGQPTLGTVTTLLSADAGFEPGG